MEQLFLSPSRTTQLNKSEVVDQLNIEEDRQCLLVVGHDSVVVGMLNEALREWGYDVVITKNGWEALMVVGRSSVAGMLVDLDMPIMDGQTMLKELRWLGYQIPVLIMSGEPDKRIHRQLMMEGAQGFCVKPVHLPSLQRVCSQVFAKGDVEEYPVSQFHIV